MSALLARWVWCIGLIAVLAACGGTDSDTPERAGSEPAGSPGAIDERRGTYRGVGLHHSEDDLFRVFGRAEPAGDEPWVPLAEEDRDFYGPSALTLSPSGRPTREAAYRYRGAVFMVSGRSIAALTVSASGARTREGVAIDDELGEARRHYRVRCGEVTSTGASTPFPACWTRVGATYVWFGGDPIADITLSLLPPSGA
jgi:hypothetical protein